MPAKKSLPKIPGLDERPGCPKCSQPMKLARVAPFKGHADIQDRTYECPKCGHSESWIASQNVPKANGGESTHH
jgi:DNA-directed RNA polymerase subunit RPC12/RpoP